MRLLTALPALGRLLVLALCPLLAIAQGVNPAERMDAQRRALAPLAGFEGEWRGTARTLLPSGEWMSLTQTERVGPMLDGTLRVIEGRGFDARGVLRFNALGVISYRAQEQRFGLRAYAMGFERDHPLELTADGFVWSTEAGPGVRLRYTVRLVEGRWVEVGERLVEGQAPVRVHEMTLERIGPTQWPAGGAVGVAAVR